MLRLTSATFAPASASARATPPVIPVPPPVTNATRSFKTPATKICSLMRQQLPPLKSATRDEGTRLHNVNLPLHVRPLDVLIFPAKRPLDFVRSRSQSPHDRITQNGSLAIDGNLFDPTAIIESQQAVFFRTSQDLHRVCARPINNLLRDLLPFDHFHAEAAFGADVNGRLSSCTIEWI